MEVIDIIGKKWNIKCMGCAITNYEMQPPGGILFESRNFIVSQDPKNPIPGFLTIQTKKHIQSLVNLTENEAIEFSKILFQSRKALNSIKDLKYCKIIQEENTQHFHTWILPFYDWMDEIVNGSINSIIPLLIYAKENWNTTEKIEKVMDTCEKVKTFLYNSQLNKKHG